MRGQKNKSKSKGGGERGFSLVVVILILLVLAFIAGAISSILAVSNRGGLDALHSTRALCIAQAGLAWALKNKTATAAPIPFDGGTFTVEKYYWRYEATGTVGKVERQVRGYRTLEFVRGTRDSDPNYHLEFTIKNQTGYTVNIKDFKLEWAGEGAYFFRVRIPDPDDEDEHITLWDITRNAGAKGAAATRYSFSRQLWLNPGDELTFKVDYFTTSPIPFVGTFVDMSQTPIKVTFVGTWSDADYEYPPTIVGVE